MPTDGALTADEQQVALIRAYLAQSPEERHAGYHLARVLPAEVRVFDRMALAIVRDEAYDADELRGVA